MAPSSVGRHDRHEQMGIPHIDRRTIMGGTSRGSGVGMVAVSTVAGDDGAARQFPSFAGGVPGIGGRRDRVRQRPFGHADASENHNQRVRTARGHASKLVDYFEALNSGDQARWERAFQQTWHPEGIVDGRNVAALWDRHRRRLVAGQIQKIHIVGDSDDYRVEFTTESGWKRDGPFVATFRDGRVYRLI